MVKQGTIPSMICLTLISDVTGNQSSLFIMRIQEEISEMLFLLYQTYTNKPDGGPKLTFRNNQMIKGKNEG